MYIFPSTGVGSEDKSDVDYVYKKVIKHKIYIKVMFNLLFAKKNHSKVISFLQLWEGEDAGVGLTDPLGISFSKSSLILIEEGIPSQVVWGGFWTTAASMPTTLWRG